MSGNKIPSLINGSTGRPETSVAGKKTPCRGCGKAIVKGEKCVDVPNPRSPFSASRRFCGDCFKKIIAKTKNDVMGLETII